MLLELFVVQVSCQSPCPRLRRRSRCRHTCVSDVIGQLVHLRGRRQYIPSPADLICRLSWTGTARERTLSPSLPRPSPLARCLRHPPPPPRRCRCCLPGGYLLLLLLLQPLVARLVIGLRSSLLSFSFVSSPFRCRCRFRCC